MRSVPLMGRGTLHVLRRPRNDGQRPHPLSLRARALLEQLRRLKALQSAAIYKPNSLVSLSYMMMMRSGSPPASRDGRQGPTGGRDRTIRWVGGVYDSTPTHHIRRAGTAHHSDSDQASRF